MKKLVIISSCVIVALSSLTGCGVVDSLTKPDITLDTKYEDYKKYTDYLVKAEGSEDDLDINGDNENDSRVYVDNLSDTNYAVCTVEMSDSMVNGDTVMSFNTGLIRPLGYVYSDDNTEEGQYFNIKSDYYYTLNYDCPVDYTWLYDNLVDTGEEMISIMYDGTYQTSDVEGIAKKEYVIGALGGIYCNLYFFDNTVVMDADYPDYPDITTCVYSAKMDYDNKTISIYEGTDMTGAAISTITMD